MRQPRVWMRSGLVLIVLGVLLSITLPNAAVGHVGGTVDHLWTQHIRPKTDARYYTKATSNSRFVNVGEKATDSATLDGHDSSDFASTTSHNFAYVDECDAAATANECAVVQIVVPAGESYHVSVWNSATALGTGADITASVCAARREFDTELTPSCISPSGVVNNVTLLAGKSTTFASSGETTVGEGTWNFSLRFNPTAPVTTDDFGVAITKILVRDASGPVPSSALTIKVVEPNSTR